MPRGKKSTEKKIGNGANLGFEEKLWQAADKMRGHMDPAENHMLVLGRVHVAAHLVGCLPELLLKAEVGSVADLLFCAFLAAWHGGPESYHSSSVKSCKG